MKYIKPFYILYPGNVDDDLRFEYDINTDAHGGCGATLMGEMWYFGGFKSAQKRQVCILQTVLIKLFIFQV